MRLRHCGFLLAALIACCCGESKDWCSSVCPQEIYANCPSAVDNLKNCCPELTCPMCPQPVCHECPSLPPIPTPTSPVPVCPKPTCPVPVCPKPTCPVSVCPKPTCPVPVCPKPTCPKPECPKPTCPKPECPCPEVKCLPRQPKVLELPKCPKCETCIKHVCPKIECPIPTCPSSTPCADCTLIRSSTTVPKNIPPGYEDYSPVGVYKFFTETRPWKSASQKCIDDGSHLATLNSEAEAIVLRYLMSERNIFRMYVGFPGKDGATVNVPGSESSSCPVFREDGVSTTVSCSKPFPFACEKLM